MNEKKLSKLLASYGNISSNGARKFFCGERLDHGASREVYVLKQDPSWVVKLEYKDDTFHNVKEWLIWDEVRFIPAIAKWLAPPLIINASGTVLVQKRVDFGRKVKKYPARMPCFFMDLKIENYGWIGDQIVCVDYASIYFSSCVEIKKGELQQLKRAKWWSEKRRRKLANKK